MIRNFIYPWNRIPPASGVSGYSYPIMVPEQTTSCIVTANNGNININGDESGIICGGENGYNNGYTGYNSSLGICYITVILKFSNCNVEASSILINNSSTGGICGGSNGSSNNYNLKGDLYFIFTNCIVFSNENNITINGNSSGGIFGGYNGMYNNGSVVLELTFIDSVV